MKLPNVAKEPVDDEQVDNLGCMLHSKSQPLFSRVECVNFAFQTFGSQIVSRFQYIHLMVFNVHYKYN